MSVIAIDFDGTIVEHKYPDIGDLKPYAKEVISLLHKEGHKIIIWTCRYLPKDLEPAIAFLDKEGIPYDKINENIEGIGFCPTPKIYADIYIDDRMIGGLPSWKKIYRIINGYWPHCPKAEVTNDD